MKNGDVMASSGPAVNVLVVVSAADSIPLREGGSHATGTYLGELIEPTDAMLAAGFSLTFASPGGKAPTIDRTSYGLALWGFSPRKRNEAKRSYERLLALGLAHPIPLEEIAHDRERLARFDALFVPGGHAPMVDLLHRNQFVDEAPNEDFGALLAYFHERQRTTGLICHAPAALAAAPAINGRWIYAGYRMTCATRMSERLIEDVPLFRIIHGHLKHYPSEVLEAKGAKLEHTMLPMGSKLVEDRELLTGQDPFSAHAFGEAFVEKVRRSTAPSAV
jgi:putative intracellular protease/amidase